MNVTVLVVNKSISLFSSYTITGVMLEYGNCHTNLYKCVILQLSIITM